MSGSSVASPTIQHRLEYVAYRIVEGSLACVSWNMAQRLGRGLGFLLRILDGRHRRMVRENLRNSDLSLSDAEQRATLKACFAHFGAMFATSPHLLRMTPEALASRVQFEGLEHWDAARKTGRGFVGLTGHYGNWEAMGLALSATGRPLYIVGRMLDNPLLANRLAALRGRFGNRIIPKAGAARESLKLLRQGECVGALLDQDALTSGVFTKFLGRWASTFQMPATLAIKYDLPVLPIFSHPEPDGTLRVRIFPPLEIPRTGDSQRDIWVATQIMTSAIDAQIRRDPRYWFWMHNRFKTRPDDPGPPPAASLPPREWIDAIPATTTQG
ncbi:MAG TPA: lysophospholipid acyltransferase family protein [Holophaga sp.]|jgi:KDO2-lipid IV(A) lauroyltransferase|nr:lysophospholipid acyltransferase family protein [Holophaga sp.]